MDVVILTRMTPELASAPSPNFHATTTRGRLTIDSCTRAFGDGPRSSESWSSDEDDTLAGTPSLNYHTTPTGGRLSSRWILPYTAGLKWY
ncbi:hypothetical protein TNCV_2055221 [Trichonephila clavipes]|uniref:Uncharacterized protein n=1 Tax=Trichonephila clavipes TaxID=2585209 RepID=A0A8X6RTW0_TRICX|nr:hypothetical protein TNCV_2055221 [Trichonephila clavipes]